MLQIFKDFVKVFTWEELEMAKDWIKLEGGKDWNDGGDYIWARISAIQTITTHPRNEGESLVNTADVQLEVKGTPEEIMEMINARTSS